tara:strand:- start:2546 stop:2830 length:285 start_codon:yes stop_codon:yes gene_type:complete
MDIKKLTDQELQQISDIQKKRESLLLELGQIELIKLDIDSRRKNAEQYLTQLQEEEKTLADWIEKQYGTGRINLETGEFIAEQPEVETVEAEEV